MTEFEKNLAVLEKSYEKGRLFEINRQEGTWQCSRIDKKNKVFFMHRENFTEEAECVNKLRCLVASWDGSMNAFWDLKIYSRNILIWTKPAQKETHRIIMDFSFLERNTLELVYDLRDIDEQKNQTN